MGLTTLSRRNFLTAGAAAGITAAVPQKLFDCWLVAKHWFWKQQPFGHVCALHCVPPWQLPFTHV